MRYYKVFKWATICYSLSLSNQRTIKHLSQEKPSPPVHTHDKILQVQRDLAYLRHPWTWQHLHADETVWQTARPVDYPLYWRHRRSWRQCYDWRRDSVACDAASTFVLAGEKRVKIWKKIKREMVDAATYHAHAAGHDAQRNPPAWRSYPDTRVHSVHTPCPLDHRYRAGHAYRSVWPGGVWRAHVGVSPYRVCLGERERELVKSIYREIPPTQLFGCKLMQSRNQSNGCCATPLQPFNCQMRRQHLRCCQPNRSAKSVPHTQSATYRCIATFSSSFLSLFLCATNATLSRQHVHTTFNFDSIPTSNSDSPFPIRFDSVCSLGQQKRNWNASLLCFKRKAQ